MKSAAAARPTAPATFGRAALQPHRQLGEAGFGGADPGHHVAAVAQRLQPFQRGTPADQRTGAHRPVHLVAREGHEIAGQRRQIGHRMARPTCAASSTVSAPASAASASRPRTAGARRSRWRRRSRRTPACAVSAGGARSCGMQPPLRIGPQDAQRAHRCAAPPVATGTRLAWCSRPLTTISSPGWMTAGWDRRRRQAMRHQVERVGRARGEDQFVRGTGADKTLEGAAGLLEGVGGALAQRVHAAVDVGPVVPLEVAHRVLHRQRRPAWWRRCPGRPAVRRGCVCASTGNCARRAGAAQAAALIRPWHVTHGRLRPGARWRATAARSSASMSSASSSRVVVEAALQARRRPCPRRSGRVLSRSSRPRWRA